MSSTNAKQRPIKWVEQRDGIGGVTAWVVTDDKGNVVRRITKVDAMTRRMRPNIPSGAKWKSRSRYYESLGAAKRAENALRREASVTAEV